LIVAPAAILRAQKLPNILITIEMRASESAAARR
jgi:hypothetical protein